MCCVTHHFRVQSAARYGEIKYLDALLAFFGGVRCTTEWFFKEAKSQDASYAKAFKTDKPNSYATG